VRPFRRLCEKIELGRYLKSVSVMFAPAKKVRTRQPGTFIADHVGL
jgi:hypothetical protein